MASSGKSLHDRLMEELTNLWDVYESLYVLVNGSTVEIQAGFDQSRLNIQTFTNAKLQKAIPQLSAQVVDLKTRYGAIASDKSIVRIARLVKETSGSQMALIP